MKRLSKFLIMILALVMVISLAGCGSKNETGTTTTPGGQSEPATQTETTLSDILGKGKTVTGIQCDYLMTYGGETPVQGKMWMQGTNMKMTMTQEGQSVTTIVNGEQKVAYTYMPQQNMAMKMAFEGANDQYSTPDEYLEKIDTANLTELGSVVYDGARCRVISMKDPASKAEMKMYIREDYGIPVRIETTAEDGKSVLIEYKNLTVGNLPADTFELPPGVQVNDLSDMMKNMGAP